jgi:hypothetical protein
MIGATAHTTDPPRVVASGSSFHDVDALSAESGREIAEMRRRNVARINPSAAFTQPQGKWVYDYPVPAYDPAMSGTVVNRTWIMKRLSGAASACAC